VLKAEKIVTYGWKDAIRGMRNPMNSWDKTDSIWCTVPDDHCSVCEDRHTDKCQDGVILGNNDLALMTKLVKAGTDHRKFLRMITVYMDITAPLYWWKEYDTYKVGTVANSCSTMHKIAYKPFERKDFSHEHLVSYNLFDATIETLNYWRDKFNTSQGKDKTAWWNMIQQLPTSYNQKRTVMLNYEVLRNIYHARKNHRLDEWHELCRVIEQLPYFEVLIA